jgi:hypothetical protein
MSDAATLVRNYLTLLESFDPQPADFAGLLHPEARQLDHPGRLPNPGPPQLAAQAFDLQHIHTCPNDTVVVEARWWGEVGADSAAYRCGQQLTAQCCMVFELHDGLIYRQRNYDVLDSRS